MHKLSMLVDGEWRPAELALRFQRQQGRIRATLPLHATPLIQDLIEVLPAPYFVLYILHTPRGEADAGRYQSPALDSAQLHEFLSRFSEYLSGDGRFDIWVHSPEEQATLVWDRHNIMFVYGPLDKFIPVLDGAGYEEGFDQLPAPHSPHYRPEFDALAAELIQSMNWRQSDLQPDDEQ